MYQNTLVNSTVAIGRNARTAANDATFGWHSSTGPDLDQRDGHVFVNNLLVGTEEYTRPLLSVWQPDSLCAGLGKSQLTQFDNTVFVKRGSGASTPPILWSPVTSGECQMAFESIESFRKVVPQFAAQSLLFVGDIPLFKNPHGGNFQLLKEFPGSKAAAPVPDDVRAALGIPRTGIRFVGAYSPSP